MDPATTNATLYEGTLGDTEVIVKAVQSSSKRQPLWRLMREVYVQAAVSESGGCDNVQSLLGWGIYPTGGEAAGGDFLGSCIEGAVMLIVLEHAGTPLSAKINAGETIPPMVALKFMEQVTVGLKHLHDKKFFHRDLKLENVALKGEGLAAEVRLIDFGSSTQVHQVSDSSRAYTQRSGSIS